MTRLDFRNRLCILRSIDRHELVEAGVMGADDFTMWNAFVNNPERFFVLCEDHRAERIWRVVDRRAVAAETNWSVAAEASKAMAVGIVPTGCSINEAGALVIPDEFVDSGLRGSTVIFDRFDDIVTTTGRVVKSRDGVLKAARAL